MLVIAIFSFLFITGICNLPKMSHPTPLLIHFSVLVTRLRIEEEKDKLDKERKLEEER